MRNQLARYRFPAPTTRRVGRTAFTIFEAVSASMVLAVVFAVLVPSIAGFQLAFQSDNARRLATQELRNAIEQVHAAQRSGDFDDEFLSQLSVRSEVLPLLKDTEFQSEQSPVDGRPGERLTLTISYGEPRRSVSLTTWLWERER